MLRLKRLFLIIFPILMIGLAACGTESQPPTGLPKPTQEPTRAIPQRSSDTFNIVVTTGIIGEPVARIGGDEISLTQLVSSDEDPRTYTLTEADREALDAADLIFYQGMDFEAAMIEDLIDYDAIAIGDEFPSARILDDRDDNPNPYTWLDARNMGFMAALIEEIMRQADADNATIYRENFQTYSEEMRNLHSQIINLISMIPQERRILVVQRDSFQYFADAYNFRMRAIQGSTLAAEANLTSVPLMTDELAENDIPIVFAEMGIDSDVLQNFVDLAEDDDHTVKVSEPLYSLNLSAEDGPASTYADLLRYNASVITRGLVIAEER